MTESRNNSNSTRTIIGQQQQEQREPYNNYNNYNTRTRTRELPGKEAMQLIAEAYRANISETITRAAATIIEEALTHGMETDTVIMAIEETGLASRPSPYYLRAVLRNWAENGVVMSRITGEIRTTEGTPWWKTKKY